MLARLARLAPTLALLLTLLLTAAAISFAAPVPPSVARTVALAHLAELGPGAAELGPSGAGGADVMISDPADGGAILAHVITLAPAGYIVVAGDDRLPPVLAYSLESDYPAAVGQENPLAQLVAADLKSRLAALPSLDPRLAAERRADWARLAGGSAEPEVARRFQQWPPAGSTPTGGWLAGNWTQSAPYNALCPLDLAHGGARSVAGCPAVAMAMILNYHQTVQGTTFGAADRYYHNYAGNAYWIPDACMQYGFPSFPTLNGYLATLTSHWESAAPLTNTDKAALVFACGTACTQVYSAAGSGTFGVNQAYNAYQRFAFTGSRLVLDTDPEMYSDLAQSMMDALPAHLAVVDPSWSTGHNVVVDGYNTDQYFHINFGWGGSYNGWYLLPQEIPYGLTVVEGLILDIVPGPSSVPGESEAPAANRLALASSPNPGTSEVVLRFDAPQAGPVRLAVYDATGRLTASLLDGVVSAGSQARTWSTRDVAAGVYFVRLEAGGIAVSRSVVITR